MDCVREAIARRDVLERSETVGKAYEAFLRARGCDGLRPRYLKDLRHRLGRFARRFDDRQIAGLSSAEIDQYIRELGGSAFNRNTVRGRLSVFF
jgi:hypothetical protein